jgi:mannose PTS system EIIA component
MSEGPVRGVVVAHGSMAWGLVEAVRAIADIEPDVLIPISNAGLSPVSLAEQVRGACRMMPVIVFTDLPSGSCGFAARLLTRELGSMAVVCGVNLPMLLDFITHRDLPLGELVQRLVDKGRASINSTPSSIAPNVDPAVPR